MILSLFPLKLTDKIIGNSILFKLFDVRILVNLK